MCCCLYAHCLSQPSTIALCHSRLMPVDQYFSSSRTHCGMDERYNLAEPHSVWQVDRLGDAKQPVRDAVAATLQTLLQVWGLQPVLPMLTFSFAHRNPRVKQGTLQAMTAAITVMPVALSLPATWLQLVLQPAAKLLDDPNRCAFEILPGSQPIVSGVCTECCLVQRLLAAHCKQHVYIIPFEQPLYCFDASRSTTQQPAPIQKRRTQCSLISAPLSRLSAAYPLSTLQLSRSLRD